MDPRKSRTPPPESLIRKRQIKNVTYLKTALRQHRSSNLHISSTLGRKFRSGLRIRATRPTQSECETSRRAKPSQEPPKRLKSTYGTTGSILRLASLARRATAKLQTIFYLGSRDLRFNISKTGNKTSLEMIKIGQSSRIERQMSNSPIEDNLPAIFDLIKNKL